MIDLDALCRQTLPVRMGGRCLQMQVPSVELVQRLLSLSDTDDKLLDRQIAIAADMLSRNTEQIAVTCDMLRKYPTSAVQAQNDPNCASPC